MELFDDMTMKRHARVVFVSFILYVIVANNIDLKTIPLLNLELPNSKLMKYILAVVTIAFSYTWIISYYFDTKRNKAGAQFIRWDLYRSSIEHYEHYSTFGKNYKKIIFYFSRTFYWVMTLVHITTGFMGLSLAIQVLFPSNPLWFGDFLLSWLNFTGKSVEYFPL